MFWQILDSAMRALCDDSALLEKGVTAENFADVYDVRCAQELTIDLCNLGSHLTVHLFTACAQLSWTYSSSDEKVVELRSGGANTVVQWSQVLLFRCVSVA